MRRSACLLLILAYLVGCKKDEFPACDDATALYAYASFPIGTAIDVTALDQVTAYRDLAIQQFNSVTPENCFKAAYLHPDPLIYNWSQADSLVQFSMAYNKRIHGHTLVWHQQLPKWMQTFEGDQQAWDRMLKDHIQTIVRHFKGKVQAWDVVNEAFDEDGSLKDNFWYQKMGASYIEKSFQYAQDVDSNALLFYNDYNLESNPRKLDAVLEYLNKLRSKGLKINGIGLQMHLSLNDAQPEAMNEAFQLVSKNGYSVHLSELDISVNPEGSNTAPSADLLQEQATLLGRIVFYYRQLPQKQQYGITFWGICDTYSWIRSYYNRMDYPLLYDDNYQPKPAYCALKAFL